MPSWPPTYLPTVLTVSGLRWGWQAEVHVHRSHRLYYGRQRCLPDPIVRLLRHTLPQGAPREQLVPTPRLTRARQEVCGELLGEQIDADNLFFLLDIVDQFDCRRLNACCGRFLAEHFRGIWADFPERLMSLKIDTWAEMLKRNELQIRYAVVHLLPYVVNFALA